MADFELKVNESNKATGLPLLRVRGAWTGLGLEVATSINMCKNQQISPADYPKRTAPFEVQKPDKR